MPPEPQPALEPNTGSSHDRLLAAAKRLFASHGYENTSTVAIARAAGTSESQLIKHFGSKEGLLEAIFDQGWQRMAYVFRAVNELPSPTDKLYALLDLVINSLERDPELKELMLLEGRRFRKEGRMILLTKGYLGLVQTVDDILTEMAKQRELRDGVNRQAVRSAIIGIFESMMRDQVLARRADFPADFSSDDIRKTFNLVIASFGKTK
jgi:AcrR family transcriptional regulator